MRLFTPSGARYFCQAFGSDASTLNIDFGKHLLKFKAGKSFKEGTNEFNSLRDCLLRDAERQAFLAAGNFAQVHRGIQGSNAAWSVVGFYYSAYFAARSLLAMHGGWVDSNRAWLDLSDSKQGSIEFIVRKSAHPSIPSKWGTHKAFWTVFYHAAKSIQNYAVAPHSYALSPIQSSDTWLIDNRNRLNYEAAASVRLTNDFLNRFDPAQIPACLPGDLKVYRNVAESLLALVAQFRVANGLATDINVGLQGNLTASITNLVRAPGPITLQTYSTDAIANFSS